MSSILYIGETEYEHGDVAHDFEIFDGDTPVAQVTVMESDPDQLFYLDETGQVLHMAGLSEISGDAIMRLLRKRGF